MFFNTTWSTITAVMLAAIFMVTAEGYSFQVPRTDIDKLPICGEKDYRKTIYWLWEKRKPVYVKWLAESSKTPYNLYNIQAETNNLLKYAALRKDHFLLEELILLYSLSLNTVDETDRYAFYYYPGNPRRSIHNLGLKHRMWLDEAAPVGDESILASSQFLYVLSEAAVIVSKMPSEEKTQAMKNGIQQFVPLLLDHYERWIFSNPGPFQVRGWGCKINGRYVQGGMNHLEFMDKKRQKLLGDKESPSYCNSVTDTDMWIIAGIANLLAASRYDNHLVQVSQKKFEALLQYARLGVDLLAERFVYTELVNFDGMKVVGALFEPGAWDDHETFAYSGYHGHTFPMTGNSADKKQARGLGMDLSHASRYVHVFDALYQHRLVLNMNFPDEDFMKKLTAQFVYAAFNKDFKRLLFTNFMDGSNGWFRVGYSGRTGFGYGPWDMSIAALYGGYGFWSKYSRDVETVYRALVEMLCSSDSEVLKHINDYYEKNHWHLYSRPRKIDFSRMENNGCQSVLIQFLPSLPWM